MALAGHSSTQVSQSTHAAVSIFAFSFSIAIASAGQISTQVEQPVQVFSSTFAGMFVYLVSITFLFRPAYMFLFVQSEV